MPETEKHVAVAKAASSTDESWLGTIETHPLNAAFKAVKVGDQWFGVKPDGTRYLDPTCSAWQAFQVSTNAALLVAGRDGGKTYLVPYAAYTGPAVP
jgi:hypothetical protein